MPPVLEFQLASLAAASAAERGVEGLTFSLEPGQAAWLECEMETTAVDLACGLRAPAAGAARYQGRAWAECAPEEQAARRGAIGRVFWDTAWISNLDVDENIALARRHHDPARPGLWREETHRLAGELGLVLAPGLRPAFASGRDLQRAQFVRALLGSPALLILEHPDRHLTADDAARVLARVAVARAAGAAVLWAGPATARLNPDTASAEVRLDLRGGTTMVKSA